MKITNEDNMLLMARYPDNYFDLAIVDPPYGIKESSYRKVASKKAAAKKKDYNMNLWNQNMPTLDYWDELNRISKNQIIWGGNYFTDYLKPSRAWIIWDKMTQDSLFADVEMAWTSWKNSAKLYQLRWNGMLQHDIKNKEIRIHPTQKPIKLYEWLLMNYAKENDKILDTHLGSGSIAIACHNLGFDLTACELDKDYYDATMKRLKEHQSQLTMFKPAI